MQPFWAYFLPRTAVVTVQGWLCIQLNQIGFFDQIGNVNKYCFKKAKRDGSFHSEDLPTYWLPLWQQWGSNPCLWFDHFFLRNFGFQCLWLKSVQSKDRIRTCNLRSICQSANHYTKETVVLDKVVFRKQKSIQ